MDRVLEKQVRTVYQRDLYDSHYSLNLRIESDRLDAGENLRITVERIDNNPTKSTDSDDKGKPLEQSRREKLQGLVNEHVKYLFHR